jgi:hypothetical protein
MNTRDKILEEIEEIRKQVQRGYNINKGQEGIIDNRIYILKAKYLCILLWCLGLLYFIIYRK